MYRSLATIVVGLLLFGCATPSGDRPIRVQVDGDEFSKEITISGVTSTYNPFGGDERGFWYLRSFVNPETHKVEHQLYFEISYGGGLNGTYYAADNSAQPHPIHLIYRDYCYFRDEVLRTPCVHRDYLGIDIPDETLRADAMQGMKIKVSARSGFALILPISTLMITAQLDAIEQINSGRVVVGKTVKSGGTINVLTPSSVNDGTGSTPAQVAPQKPVLGISYLKVMFTGDVIVSEVKPGSAAAAAGLLPDDVLVRYDGRPIKTEDDVRDSVDNTKPGSVVKIEIRRRRQPLTLSAQM